MEWMLAHSTLMLIIAGSLGFFMALGVGANDVANAMGTSVGARALTIRQAILIAIIFEFCGAYFAGGEVTATIRSGIIDSSAVNLTPQLLIYGMMASLVAAGIWLIVASWCGWPVSTTHTIIGAIVGFAVVGLGPDTVHWQEIWSIVGSWVLSPFLAGVIAFGLIKSVQRLVLNHDNPFERAKKVVPWYLALVGFIISMMTLTKGLKHVGLNISDFASCGLSILIGLIVAGIGVLILRRVKSDPEADKKFRFSSVERVFGVLMIFTACTMAFAHGSNDVANAIGPLAAIQGVLTSGGAIAPESVMPNWILLLGAMGIVFGLVILGSRVMATIGTRITALTPSRGFAAELAAATTVVLASSIGMPVSTTHTLVGAILGVGMARGIGSINLRMISTIFTSWVITLPAGAALSILFFYFFKGLFAV